MGLREKKEENKSQKPTFDAIKYLRELEEHIETQDKYIQQLEIALEKVWRESRLICE